MKYYFYVLDRNYVFKKKSLEWYEEGCVRIVNFG